MLLKTGQMWNQLQAAMEQMRGRIGVDRRDRGVHGHREVGLKGLIVETGRTGRIGNGDNLQKMTVTPIGRGNQTCFIPDILVVLTINETMVLLSFQVIWIRESDNGMIMAEDLGMFLMQRWPIRPLQWLCQRMQLADLQVTFPVACLP